MLTSPIAEIIIMVLDKNEAISISARMTYPDIVVRCFIDVDALELHHAIP